MGMKMTRSRPKTYLLSLCLLIVYKAAEVNSCATYSSKPAAAKFQAETNNGIWWPPEEDNVSSNHNHREEEYSRQEKKRNDEEEGEEDKKHSYKLPDSSNETGMNGHEQSERKSSSGSKRTNNNSDNNEEQPQITASREPHHSQGGYYRRDDGVVEEAGEGNNGNGSGDGVDDDGGSRSGGGARSKSSSYSGTSDGSSKDLIESSIISPVPEPNLHQTHHHHQKHQKQSSGSGTGSGSLSRRLMAKSVQGLELVHFSNKSITCNDGTTAGYYIRKSSLKGNDENLWIIFLEGGWYCFDQRSCMTRWHRLKHLMSSDGWPSVRNAGGILSPDPNENPYWWNANHVFVPYCSSDTWSGRVRGNENGNPFSFMGALIIDEVIKSLITVEGLDADSSVILAGSSAGGTGVMINVDHVETLLTKEFGSLPEGMQRVKGITDSGWFIDKVPLYTEKANCHDVILCPPEISLRKGMNLWNARLPKSCRESHIDDPWSCFFGYRIYPTLKASLFVFQWLFDEAQMVINNVPTPALRKEEWDYVYRIGDELKKTLMNVTNVFIPSCLAHTVLTNRDWRKVEVNSIELTRALKCWESGGTIEESNYIPKKSRKSPQKYWEDYEQDASLLSSGPRGVYRHGKVYSSTTIPTPFDHSSSDSGNDFSSSTTVTSNDSSRRNRRRHNRHRHKKHPSSSSSNQNHRQNRRRRKKLEKRQKLHQQKESTKSSRSSSGGIISSSKPKKKEQRQRSVDRLGEMSLATSTKSNVNFDSVTSLQRRNVHSHHHRNNNNNNNSNNHNKNKQKKRKRNRRWFSVCDGTSRRLIEKCSWPQCGRTCPKLLNPLTGEEVDFKDLLKSFGLDLATMAKALGIDLATLNSMDHQVLLQMLTQNA